ncbi:hypothetical protein Mapa_006292 [Marchantia paleacea]|nr:hypothetical protein Mapa_006292 [Marchantia paleacea]
MQSWGWGNVPPVAIGKFSEDGKGHQVSPVSTPASTEGSDDGKLTLKDRRLALEQEVSKLRKKHAQEVNLHKALERALQRPVGVLPRIPSYLPAKIQKLLAEVAVLEEEVIRLEDHVVYLRNELNDEAQQVNSWGTQKQPNNFNAANNAKSHANDLSKPNHLTKIRLKKDASVPIKEPPVKEVTKEVKDANKSSYTGRKKTSTDSKDTKKSDQPVAKLLMSFKSNSSKEGKDKDKDRDRDHKGDKDHKDNSKEHKDGKDSKESSKESAKTVSPTKSTKSPRRTGVTGKSAAPTLTPAPTAVTARKAPVSDVLSRFQGMQQPWKPSGTNAKNNNLLRQFNSLGWNDKQPHLTKQQSTSSPRFNAGSNSSASWLDRPISALPKGDSSSPRAGARNPFSGGSNTRLWEKENLQSSAAAKIASRSPRASKLGFSVDFESSNVDRKSSIASKALLAAVQPASKMGFTSAPKDAPTIEPNRLSEELVKCLVNIYNKLAKVPATDVKSSKSGSKTPVHASASRNNGHKSGEDTAAATDFYGVCKDHPRDVGPYKHIHEITVDTIDSSGISSCTALYKKLGSLMEQLEKADLQALSHHEKLAFWINIYNVCMMHAFLERGIPSSPSKVVALMRKAVVNVGGYVLNALTIEHFILRLPCRPKNVRTSPWKHFQRSEAIPTMAFMKNVGMEEIIERSAYGLDWHEPLVTFGLCCGSRSSPALRVYTSAAVEHELETAKREYLQAAVGVNAQDKILLPKLLEWYMRDFAKDMESLLEWVCGQLSSPLRESVQECLNHPREGVLSHSIEVMPYDFNFRYIFLI